MNILEIEQIKIEKIKEICEQNHIDMTVIFGSSVSGRIHNESDIDIGIFRKGIITLENQAVLNKEFSNLFQSNKIDITIISSNNPILMYNILQNGRVLYSSEATLFMRLKLYAWKLFVESKKFRDHSFNILKTRVVSL